MPVEIDISDARWRELAPNAGPSPALESALETLAGAAAAAVLRYLGHDPAGFEIAVLASDDARIRALNAQFRGKDSATNVLSWPTWDLSAETPGAPPEPPETGTPEAPEALGDIALAYETCRREALAQQKSLQDHVSHLIVHAVLHLLGYDHQTDADAEVMEEIERCVLAQLGIADPYAGDESITDAGAPGVD